MTQGKSTSYFSLPMQDQSLQYFIYGFLVASTGKKGLPTSNIPMCLSELPVGGYV